ncbi:MAG: MarR family winged helix-turn-helix transcriptional regulator [Granulosicoccaceae bacterium]
MSEFSQDYLHYLLAQTSAAVSETFHAKLASQRIPAGEWRVLASLHPDLELSVGELAKECLIKPSTLSRTLDRLESNKLLAREHTHLDRRQVRVGLTTKGRVLACKLIEQAREQEQLFLKNYSAEDIARLKTLLRELTARATKPD